MENKFKTKYDPYFNDLQQKIINQLDFNESICSIFKLIKKKSIYPSKFHRFLKQNLRIEKLKLNQKSLDLVISPILELIKNEKNLEDISTLLKIIHYFSFEEIGLNSPSCEEYIKFLTKSIDNKGINSQIFANIYDLLSQKIEQKQNIEIIFAKKIYEYFTQLITISGNIFDIFALSNIFKNFNLLSQTFSTFLNEIEIQQLFFNSYKFIFVGTSFGSHIKFQESEETYHSSGLSEFSTKDIQNNSQVYQFEEKLILNSIAFLNSLFTFHKVSLKQIWNQIFKCETISFDFQSNHSNVIFGKNSEIIEIQKIFHSPTINYLVFNAKSSKIIGSLTSLTLNVFEVLPMKLLLPLNPEKFNTKKIETFHSQAFYVFNCLKNFTNAILYSISKCTTQGLFYQLFVLLNSMISKKYMIKMPFLLKERMFNILISNLNFQEEIADVCLVNSSILNSLTLLIDLESTENTLNVPFQLFSNSINELDKTLHNFQKFKLKEKGCISTELIAFLCSTVQSSLKEIDENFGRLVKCFDKIIQDFKENPKKEIFGERFLELIKSFEKLISKNSNETFLCDDIILIIQRIIQIAFENLTKTSTKIFSLIANMKDLVMEKIYQHYPTFISDTKEIAIKLEKNNLVSFFSALGSISLLNLEYKSQDIEIILTLFHSLSPQVLNVNAFNRLTWAHCNWISKACKQNFFIESRLSFYHTSMADVLNYIDTGKEKIVSNGIRVVGTLIALNFFFDKESICIAKTKIFQQLENDSIPKVHWNCCVAIISVIESNNKKILEIFSPPEIFQQLLKLFSGSKIIKTLTLCCQAFASVIDLIDMKEKYEDCIILVNILEKVYSEINQSLLLLNFDDFKLHPKFKVEIGFLFLKLLHLLFASFEKLDSNFIDYFNANSASYFSKVSFSFLHYSKIENEKVVTANEEEKEKEKETLQKMVLLEELEEKEVKGLGRCIERIIDFKEIENEQKAKINRNLGLFKVLAQNLIQIIDSHSNIQIPFFLYDFLTQWKDIIIGEKIYVKLLSD